MPRFDNEGFNPERRIENDSRDRSVPDNENYYRNITPDYDFNSRNGSSPEVRDNQKEPLYPMQNTSYEEEERRKRAELEEYRRQRAEQRSKQKSGKKKSKKKNRKKAVLAVILAVILVLIGMAEGVLAKIHYDEQKENQYVSASELESDGMVKNILLLGVDARENQEKETSRPDTMMLVSFDMKHHCIKMTSFLRDTWVYVPSLEKEQRLNASTGKDGYSGVVDAIEYNFGVQIDGYVVTNFEMFQVLVDSIGGVTVKVTKKEAKEVNSHPGRYGKVKLKAGTRKLSGKQALAYCRIRKIDTDFNRTGRQRTVMTAILNKAKSNPFTLYKMAAKSAKYIETDLSKAQLRALAAFAGICISGDMFQEKVPFEGTWEYANIGGASVIRIDIDENKEKLIDFIYHKSAKDLKESEKNAK